MNLEENRSRSWSWLTTPQEVWNTPSSTSHTSEAVLGMRLVAELASFQAVLGMRPVTELASFQAVLGMRPVTELTSFQFQDI